MLLRFVIELLLLVIVRYVLQGYSEILVSFSILFKAILKFQLFFSKWTIRILVPVTISKYSKLKYIFSFSFG